MVPAIPSVPKILLIVVRPFRPAPLLVVLILARERVVGVVPITPIHPRSLLWRLLGRLAPLVMNAIVVDRVARNAIPMSRASAVESIALGGRVQRGARRVPGEALYKVIASGELVNDFLRARVPDPDALGLVRAAGEDDWGVSRMQYYTERRSVPGIPLTWT